MSLPANGEDLATEGKSLLVAAEAYEQALRQEQSAPLELVLYVAGTAPRSLRAIANIRRLCDQHLNGRCDLEVVDIYQQPALAEAEGILAVPVLIKKWPLPVLRFIGDLSDPQRVIDSLGLSSPFPGDGA